MDLKFLKTPAFIFCGALVAILAASDLLPEGYRHWPSFLLARLATSKMFPVWVLVILTLTPMEGMIRGKSWVARGFVRLLGCARSGVVSGMSLFVGALAGLTLLAGFDGRAGDVKAGLVLIAIGLVFLGAVIWIGSALQKLASERMAFSESAMQAAFRKVILRAISGVALVCLGLQMASMLPAGWH